MAWGLPPSFKQKEKFSSTDNLKLKEKALKALKKFEFEIIAESSYSIKAKKKMPLTFMSVFSFTRPKLDTYIMFSEDGIATIEITYRYTDNYTITINDMGKSKKYVTLIIEKMRHH